LVSKAAVKNTANAELAPGDRRLYVESAHAAPRTDHAEYPDFSAANRGPEKRWWDQHAYFGVHCVCTFPSQLARLSIYALPSAASSADQSQPQTPALVLSARPSHPHKRNRDMAAKTCQAQSPNMPAVAARAASLGDGRGRVSPGTLPPRRGQIKENILKDVVAFVAAVAAGLVKNGRGGTPVAVVPADK
jgi:hypothetical protein